MLPDAAVATTRVITSLAEGERERERGTVKKSWLLRMEERVEKTLVNGFHFYAPHYTPDRKLVGNIVRFI